MRSLTALAIALVTYAVCVRPAAADDNDRFSITPYVWLPTVEGDFGFHIPPADPSGPEFFPNVDVGPVDYLENLQGALMVAGEARFGRASIFTDFMYLDFSNEDARVRTIGGSGAIPPIDIGTTFDFSGAVWTLAGGYDFIRNENWRLQAFAGFRYLGVDAQVDWQLSGPIGLFPPTGSVESESDTWDGLVGVRGRAQAGDWFFPYYADVGAGDSDLTWQGLIGVGYGFGWGDLRLDFRHLEYEQDEGSLVQELSFSGPAIGATFRF